MGWASNSKYDHINRFNKKINMIDYVLNIKIKDELPKPMYKHIIKVSG
jgi:hypothetical protein